MGIFNKLLPEGHLLEIGCGGGRDAAELIALGYQYTGIDPSVEMFKAAQERNPKGTFIHASAQEIDFEGEFEGFWASASLLHVPKKEIDGVMQRINKALKDGGVGFIALKKHLDGEDEREETDKYGTRVFTYWTADGFTQVLNRNGFEVVGDVEERPVSEKTVWLVFMVRKVASS